MYGNLQLSGSEHYGPCLAIGALGYDCVVIIVSRDAKLSSAIDTRVHTDAVSHNHITQFRCSHLTGVSAISIYLHTISSALETRSQLSLMIFADTKEKPSVMFSEHGCTVPSAEYRNRFFDRRGEPNLIHSFRAR